LCDLYWIGYVPGGSTGSKVFRWIEGGVGGAAKGDEEKM